MAKRPLLNDPELLRQDLLAVLQDFEEKLKLGTLREQVRGLIPAWRKLRGLGASLMLLPGKSSAQERVLKYLQAHVGEVISGEELMIVSGIGDYPRRIRELRKEQGWAILSGAAAIEMQKDARSEGDMYANDLAPAMQVDDYMLVEDRQDRYAAHRWHTANRIRRGKKAVKAKILEYFRENVGQRVTSDELRYVANGKSEWARRTRELRTEDGWPVVTRQSGDPSLLVGVYVLAADEQAPPHDRHIKELTRRDVMRRDNWSCQWKGCGWSIEQRDRDPRFLEAHHIEHHAKGGSNEVGNLVTLCNLHHDEVHRTGELILEEAAAERLGIGAR